MTVRAKPWTLDSNTNSNSCDGTNSTINGWSGGSTSDFLQQLVDECGDLCLGCTDCDEDGTQDKIPKGGGGHQATLPTGRARGYGQRASRDWRLDPLTYSDSRALFPK